MQEILYMIHSQYLIKFQGQVPIFLGSRVLKRKATSQLRLLENCKFYTLWVSLKLPKNQDSNLLVIQVTNIALKAIYSIQENCSKSQKLECSRPVIQKLTAYLSEADGKFLLMHGHGHGRFNIVRILSFVFCIQVCLKRANIELMRENVLNIPV